MKGNKIVVFSESKETGDYLQDQLNKEFPNKVLSYSSEGGTLSGARKTTGFARDLIKENYDPNNKVQKDELQILISTDILSEGVNLHRSNIILNYDLPWNPSRAHKPCWY